MLETLENPDDVAERRFRLLLEVGAKTPAGSDANELELPPYYDREKFRVGQRVFNDNIFTMMIAKLSGLLALLAVPSILNVLKFTKQSGTPCAAFRRYASTILHTCMWYDKTPEEHTEFFKSLKNVRRKHCVAFKRSVDAGFDNISQLDMALTQFGFIGFTLLCGNDLGLVATEKDVEGLIHVWRVIGSMLGIEERFNLCAGSVEETRALCVRLLDEIFVPHMANEAEDFNEMGTVLLEGLWPINPFVEPAAFKAFTYRISNLAASNNNQSLVIDTTSMRPYSRFIYSLQCWVHENLLRSSRWWSPIFRAYFNGQMTLAVFLTENWPFLAYWLYGKQRSAVNIYKMHLE